MLTPINLSDIITIIQIQITILPLRFQKEVHLITIVAVAVAPQAAAVVHLQEERKDNYLVTYMIILQTKPVLFCPDPTK